MEGLVIDMPPKNKITRVCYPANLYMLLQYLLLSTPEEIESTFFFFSGPRFESVRKKIKKHKFFMFYAFPRILRALIWLPYWLWYMLLKDFLWGFLRHSDFFINDHLTWGAILGKKYKYNLLEDGLALHVLPEQNWGTIRSFILSPFPQSCWGRNNNCTQICLTKPLEKSNPLNTLNVDIKSLEELWIKSSSQKKKIILDIFDVSQADAELIEKSNTLILTQPFSEVNLLTLEEEIQSIKKMIADLKLKDFMIKKHPGEKKDYKKYFPEAAVYEKRVPMELFVLLGCNFSKIVTVSSSAIIIFKDKAEIVWYGRKFSEKLNQQIDTSYPTVLK